MPFVNDEHRGRPDMNVPGDRCFVEYGAMMALWKESPRWATVDSIAALIWPDKWRRARILAFLVFFAIVVMPYELKKREENGDI